ncbi:aldo/keto reductase [Sulfodiicoccus acidiphilus]|nr:aldo/keto reductase [Sulfodiicoccus acidiphilus]BBD72341.1 aldo/keto reductase [Sulfodiicoccus acidiphilus]
MNLIDTAEIYGSEPLVREAIRGAKREELFVATKVWSNHLRRESLFKALEGSLNRLGLNYVDLYQVHFPNRRVPISETMGAMEEMVDKGKIRHIGISNFSLKQTEEAVHSLKKYELASIQINYSLSHRVPERDLIPYCQKEGIAVMAYYPLAHGKLSNTSEKLRPLLQKYGKTPSQLALNWLASIPNVFPIPRASKVEHVKENLEAVGWRMDDSDRRELERLVAGQ